MDATTDREEASRLLSIYLRDHRAGAAAGIRLAQRCHRAHRGDELGALLGDVERQIADDRDSLDATMQRLGVSRSTPKELMAVATEWLGRFKLNGRSVRRSPLSTLLEVEGLRAGVTMKRDLWCSLAALAPEDPQLDVLIERADAQLARLEEAHRTAASAALAPVRELDEQPAQPRSDSAINDTEARYGPDESPA